MAVSGIARLRIYRFVTRAGKQAVYAYFWGRGARSYRSGGKRKRIDRLKRGRTNPPCKMQASAKKETCYAKLEDWVFACERVQGSPRQTLCWTDSCNLPRSGQESPNGWGFSDKFLNLLVDLIGIEPMTSSMPWKRAPSCATGPLLLRDSFIVAEPKPQVNPGVTLQ